MIFKLEIQMGNDAMRDERDIASALIRLSDTLVQGESRGGGVRDANGNGVGAWYMEESD